MVELKHGAHECVLTTPKIVANGICNICFKDKPVEVACDPCNFDLCRPCSKLPLKVSRNFHPHPLEFCVGTKNEYMLCHGCGGLFSGSSYYKCKKCEIYLDLGCAILDNTKTSWDAKEMLHYSHAHLLRRCKPGPDARGSCLMCELPLTPSAICYGCVRCYTFVHERCLNLPREVKHPVHPEHPLVRLDFTHTCGPGKSCNACGLHIEGAPLSCAECSFDLHLRCADSLLRGLVHKSHHHKLFYVANIANKTLLGFKNGCGVCMGYNGFYRKPYYYCVECGWRVHLKCLNIPKYVVKRSFHIHPLVCKIFSPEEEDSLEYCGVCETKIHTRHLVYCCKECDFVGHLECILREEAPSPLYVKELYICGEDVTRTTYQEDRAIKEIENQIVINDLPHNHKLTFVDKELYNNYCGICYQKTVGSYWGCDQCAFQAHDKCVKLRQESIYRFHLKHPLTLLPGCPAGTNINCDVCKTKLPSFNLFCRICSFIICTKCVLKANQFHEELYGETYSHLPKKVSHDVHLEHPLQLLVTEFESIDATTYRLCSGCGDLFSTPVYYKCEDCEIYLDLGCATMNSIKTSWHVEKLLHYSHAHLLQRCRPGPDAGKACCLMCELPLTPFAICYGCAICYSFVHERCLNLPREIQHLVHPAHPLIRLDFTNTCGRGKYCDACGLHIDGSPLGCQQCNFYLHLRCADFLLRCIRHAPPGHFFFYRPAGAGKDRCQICKGNAVTTLDSYYYCVACGVECHFECAGIPLSIIEKSHHIHPLFCTIFRTDDNSMEYCDVCETILHEGHHVYSCKDCDFLSHIECIVNPEVPSPLYLKDLYSCGANVTRPGIQDHECETNDLENKILVTGIEHNHVMTFGDVEGYLLTCGICGGIIHGSLWRCDFCGFMAHDSCVNIRQQSRYRFHLNHPLTLMPGSPAGTIMTCDTCKKEISSFNLFCRICNFIICIKCMVKAKKSFGELQRGQKFIGNEEKRCLNGDHNLVQVMVSTSYSVSCTICDERLSGKVMSCKECEEIYHFQCIEHGRLELRDHPLHYHRLNMRMRSGSRCTICKMDITKYGFSCSSSCPVNFHLKCVEAFGISKETEWCNKHYVYNFWSNEESSLTRPCTVCNRHCGASFYGCINNCSMISAHVECIGFPNYVKNQRHQHIVMLTFAGKKNCSLCGLDIKESGHSFQYSCEHCEDVFHTECIMSTVAREAATEEEQISDIYLMYIEQVLLKMLKEGWSSSGDSNSDEEDSD